VSEARWYYAVGDQQQGPVSWAQLQQMARSGQITPDQLVWGEGMDQWAAASTVAGLFAPGRPVPEVIPVAYARPIDDKTRKILKNAKSNCIVMFVIFCIAAPVSLLALATNPPSIRGFYVYQNASGAGCTCCLWPLASLFAAVYLPLRWQYLKKLSPTFRTLGLIGGFGLIGMLILWVLGILIAMFLR